MLKAGGAAVWRFSSFQQRELENGNAPKMNTHPAAAHGIPRACALIALDRVSNK